MKFANLTCWFLYLYIILLVFFLRSLHGNDISVVPEGAFNDLSALSHLWVFRCTFYGMFSKFHIVELSQNAKVGSGTSSCISPGWGLAREVAAPEKNPGPPGGQQIKRVCHVPLWQWKIKMLCAELETEQPGDWGQWSLTPFCLALLRPHLVYVVSFSSTKQMCMKQSKSRIGASTVGKWLDPMSCEERLKAI